MNKATPLAFLAAVCLVSTFEASAEPVTLFEARVHGFNQGNRNLDIHVFNEDGSDAGYTHDLQCSIVYWANADTTFPFQLTYDPAARQVTWIVDTPDSGPLTTTSPTAPPPDPVNNLHLYVRATAGASVSTCIATPYQTCQAGGWDCNTTAEVASSAVYLTDLQLDGAPLADLSAVADLGNPTPLEAVDVPVDPNQAWMLTGNVQFTWASANGHPPKETRIMFSAAGQRIPPSCTDEDADDFSVEGGDCGPIDCNDSDPNTHPGASEICDGVDNQCPGDPGYGQVDEGCSTQCVGSAAASTYPASPVCGTSELAKHLAFFLLPAGAVILISFRRRKK